MECDKIKLSDINFSQLQLVKESTSSINGQDHSRWVFKQTIRSDRTSPRSRYFKIWNPNHVRRDNVIHALQSGFYDETIASALSGLIFHNETCRGYVVEACKLTYRDDQRFYETLKNKTIDCGFFAIQYSPYHMGLYKGRYSLFDLEGVHPLSDLPNMAFLESYFDSVDYGQFVLDRFKAIYPDMLENIGDREFLQDQSTYSALKATISRWGVIRHTKILKTRLAQWAAFRRKGSDTRQIHF